MHKAAYWSVHNYEKRLDEDVRESFMRHVVEVHNESREQLKGLSGRVLAAYSQIDADLFAHVVPAEIWMSRVATEKSSKKDLDCAQTPGQAQVGATRAAIVKMMGPRSAKPATQRDDPGQAAASPEQVWCLP
jgi:hypothetical protein